MTKTNISSKELSEVERKINNILSNHAGELYGHMGREYERIHRKITRYQADVSNTLEEYEKKDGTISKSRLRSLLRELDEIAPEVSRELSDEIEKEVTKTAESANKKIAGAFIGLLGLSLVFGSRDNKPTRQDVVDDVNDYVMNTKGKDGLDLKERIAAFSSLLVGEVQNSIRYGTMRGESVGKISNRVRDSFRGLSWHIKRFVMTEIPHAFRKAIIFIGSKTGILKGIRIVDYRGRHRYHEQHECYRLAEQDKYGMGKGVYVPSDTFILNPHPQCTAYFEYIFKKDLEEEG